MVTKLPPGEGNNSKTPPTTFPFGKYSSKNFSNFGAKVFKKSDGLLHIVKVFVARLSRGVNLSCKLMNLFTTYSSSEHLSWLRTLSKFIPSAILVIFINPSALKCSFF